MVIIRVVTDSSLNLFHLSFLSYPSLSVSLSLSLSLSLCPNSPCRHSPSRLLTQCSHLILDEIHERDLTSDFLIIVVKELLSRRLAFRSRSMIKFLIIFFFFVCKVPGLSFTLFGAQGKKSIMNFVISPPPPPPLSLSLFHRPDLKVVLMSATLNADLFSSYFGEWGNKLLLEETATAEGSWLLRGFFSPSCCPSLLTGFDFLFLFLRAIFFFLFTWHYEPGSLPPIQPQTPQRFTVNATHENFHSLDLSLMQSRIFGDRGSVRGAELYSSHIVTFWATPSEKTLSLSLSLLYEKLVVRRLPFFCQWCFQATAPRAHIPGFTFPGQGVLPGGCHRANQVSYRGWTAIMHFIWLLHRKIASFACDSFS